MTNVIIIKASILKKIKVTKQITNTTTMSPITLVLRKMTLFKNKGFHSTLKCTAFISKV